MEIGPAEANLLINWPESGRSVTTGRYEFPSGFAKKHVGVTNTAEKANTILEDNLEKKYFPGFSRTTSLE